MRNILLGSLRRSSVDDIDTEPFELDPAKLDEPSEFDMEMLVGDYVYRYGFSVTQKMVVAEWLFRSSGEQRAISKPLFIRDGAAILEHNKRVLRELDTFDIATLLPNALLLPRLDQLNNAISKDIMGWFKNLNALSGSFSSRYTDYSTRHINDVAFRDNMLRLIRMADNSIQDVSVNTREMRIDDLPPRIRRAIPDEAKVRSIEAKEVMVVRKDASGADVAFDMDEKESEGTIKIFELSGPITDILNHGSILVIDEMEAKLHPSLSRRLVLLFLSERSNPNHAQLIFVTHDATLLHTVGLRRDQVWFCEKDISGRSNFYCLAEIRSESKTRKQDHLEKKYLEGRFGAVPYFADDEKAVVSVRRR